MFQQLMNFLAAPEPPRAAPDLRCAVAILLLEAARQDDHFAPEEQAVIARLLREKFALSAAECGQLLKTCEASAARMVQLHPYTQAVFTQMEPKERIHLMEMLWEVVYADGVLDPEEDALMRRLGGLVYVTDRDRVLARRRVLARLGRGADENCP
jgi:uncharacterized tellurite resistance protein B-like protein